MGIPILIMKYCIKYIYPHNGTFSHFYVHSSEFITKISNSIEPIEPMKMKNGNVSSIEMYLKNFATTTNLSSACQKAKVTSADNVIVIDEGLLGKNQ